MEKRKLIKGVNGTPIEDTETTQFTVPEVDGRLDMVIAFDTTGSMAQLGIQFDTVSIHGLPWYKQLSEITGGVSVPFRSDNKTAELIEAASLSRGGRKSRELFSDVIQCYMAIGDSEMTSVCREYAKINKKKRAEDLGIEESELPF